MNRRAQQPERCQLPRALWRGHILTNFIGDDSIALITPGDLILITDFRYKEQAQIEAGWLKAVIRDGKMETALAETLLGSKAKRVGFEANRASFGQIHALDIAVKKHRRKTSAEASENAMKGK